MRATTHSTRGSHLVVGEGREWWSSPQSGLMPESTAWEIDSGLTVVMMRKKELTNISPPQEPSDIGQIFRSVSPSHHSPIGPSWKKIFHTQPGFGFNKANRT